MPTFITDRTSLDVAEAQYFFTAFWDDLEDEEKTKWLANLKGCFNFTDYNRLTEVVNQINGSSLDYPYSILEVPKKTKIEALFNGIATARSLWGGFSPRVGNTLDVVNGYSYYSYLDTTANFLDFERLNTLEQALEVGYYAYTLTSFHCPIDFDFDFDLNEYVSTYVYQGIIGQRGIKFEVPEGYVLIINQGKWNSTTGTWTNQPTTTYIRNGQTTVFSFTSENDKYITINITSDNAPYGKPIKDINLNDVYIRNI